MPLSLNLKKALQKLNKLLLTFFFLLGIFFLFTSNKIAEAATFQMQTGYYIGNAGTLPISGLGFTPELVIIKSDTSAGSGIWKSSSLPASNTAFFSATANNTSSLITLDNDGFTVANNANTNSINIRYTWVAFAGSDCSASGTFCVGTYTGNGSSPRAINVGFTPSLVITKRSTSLGANFRTTSMANNKGDYFITTAANTTGVFFTTLDATGFTVGATNNTNAGLYYYIAFKSVSDAMNVGTYTGNGLDNRNITGVGFTPDFAFVKNSTSATANNRIPYMNLLETYGDYSSRIDSITANAVNMIQALQADGFQVGSGVNANENAQTIYYAAFAGVPSPSASGTFKMATGTYTGTGAIQSITNVGFSPDLVMIKDTTSSGTSIFRTSLMKGTQSGYLSSATANFNGAITSLNADGFSLDTNIYVNNAGTTYYWQAFGNAWNPETKSGATDFTIGAIMGNGIDSRNITEIPFQPNFVAIKRSGATAGAFRTSSMTGDLTNPFTATAERTNIIQTLNSDGFQIGTGANANTAANLYNWFAFSSGTNFYVNNYTGNGTSQNITAPNIQPDLVWIKRSTAVNPVHRNSSISGDSTQSFTLVADVTNRITSFLTNGFSIGSGAEVNTNAGIYRYIVWKITAIATIGTEDTQTANVDLDSTNQFIGTFTIQRDYGSTDLTSITISETGTVDATNDLANTDIYYETAADCSYEGNENLFGTDPTFNGSEEATVTGSTTISSSQTCLYVVLDILATASDGETIELSISIPSSDVIVSKGYSSPGTPIAASGTTTIQGAPSGALEIDIVDGSGIPVDTPSISMTNRTFDFGSQTSTGTLGTASEKIHISNTTNSAPWTLSIAPSAGPTAFWDGTTTDYDFNDPTANAADGADADNFGGKMTINPSTSTITPQIGCNDTGLTLGSSSSFSEGITNAITLLTASSAAGTNCYWDLTNIAISQTVPAEQHSDNYSINMTITITAN